MPGFSEKSQAKLHTCHPDLIQIFTKVVEIRDCTIIEGYRDEETQNEYFRTGKSQVQFPNGNHNRSPSMAADVMEYFPDRPHIRWSDKDGIEDFANYVIDVADMLRDQGEITHMLRWGGDWDRDGVRVDHDPDERFFDGPHFELTEAV